MDDDAPSRQEEFEAKWSSYVDSVIADFTSGTPTRAQSGGAHGGSAGGGQATAAVPAAAAAPAAAAVSAASDVPAHATQQPRSPPQPAPCAANASSSSSAVLTPQTWYNRTFAAELGGLGEGADNDGNAAASGDGSAPRLQLQTQCASVVGSASDVVCSGGDASADASASPPSPPSGSSGGRAAAGAAPAAAAAGGAAVVPETPLAPSGRQQRSSRLASPAPSPALATRAVLAQVPNGASPSPSPLSPAASCASPAAVALSPVLALSPGLALSGSPMSPDLLLSGQHAAGGDGSCGSRSSRSPLACAAVSSSRACSGGSGGGVLSPAAAAAQEVVAVLLPVLAADATGGGGEAAVAADRHWHSERRIPAIWLGEGGEGGAEAAARAGRSEAARERVLGRSSDGGHGAPNVCGIMGDWARISRRHTQLRFVAAAPGARACVEVSQLSLNPCAVHGGGGGGGGAQRQAPQRLAKGGRALAHDGDRLHLHASLPVMFVVRVGSRAALEQEEAASAAAWGWIGGGEEQIWSGGAPRGEGTHGGGASTPAALPPKGGGKRGSVMRSACKHTPPLRKRLPAARSWDTPPPSLSPDPAA